MTEIEKAAAYVIGIAEAEVGYLEKATNANLNDKTANAGSGNWTKYAAYFDAQRGEYEYYNGKKNGFDWCDMFFDWCQCQAWGIDEGRKVVYQPMQSAGAGCPYSASYYRANNAWFTVPKPGDQIFFGAKGKETHTGMVVDVSGDKVWTVEGNASNRVMRRTYYLSDGNIAGYGRPNYQLVADRFAEVTDETPTKDDAETPTQFCKVDLPVLRNGSSGGYVKTLQILLNGYAKAGLGVDGRFGAITEQAVKAYQKSRNLGVDGVVGAITWSMLLK